MSSTWTETADTSRIQEVARMQRSGDAAFALLVVSKQKDPDYAWLFDAKHPLHAVYRAILTGGSGAAISNDEDLQGRQKRVRDAEDGEAGVDEREAATKPPAVLLATKEDAEARAVLFQPFSLHNASSEVEGALPSYHGPHHPYALSAVDHRLWTSLLFYCPQGGAHFNDCIQFALGRVTKTEYLLEALWRVVSFEELQHRGKSDETMTESNGENNNNEGSVDLVFSFFFLVSSLLAEHEQGAAGRKVPFPPYRPVFAFYVPKLVTATVKILGGSPTAKAEEKLGYLDSVLKDWKDASLFPLTVVEEWIEMVGGKPATTAPEPASEKTPGLSASAKARTEEYEAV